VADAPIMVGSTRQAAALGLRWPNPC